MTSNTALRNNIRIVLVNTSHPGNIGAVARAMKNMSLSQLYLVQPKFFPSDEATARASGATEILEQAVVCESLAQAIADCQLVVGASARLRTVAWPQLEPRQCGETLVQAAAQSRVALVMGREQSGLSNDELDLCQKLVHIPSNPDYSSLNVAMAVQVLAYEIHTAALATEVADQQASAAESVPTILPSEKMQNFFAHLEQTLIDIHFLDERQSDKLLRRLKRFFYRAAPDEDELNILRGILSAAQGRKSMRKQTPSSKT
ncbi:MAG: RNA methyltransferase [Chromatiales bacterium]|jgi:tRNA (cytidine32/uridine32-2'-O)-methyltransferase